MGIFDSIVNAARGSGGQQQYSDISGVKAPPADRANSTSIGDMTGDKANRANFFRVPFEMDCVKWRTQEKKKKIVFRCNPNKVDYDWPIRGATQNVKVGKVFYWWKNKDKASHFDVPTITFSFQSGNIMVLQENGQGEMYVPEGLDNFYEFMSLYDEDKIIEKDGSPNFVTIVHHSPIFPNLTLTGFFDPSQAIAPSESSEDAAMVNWTAKFLIHESNPRFNSAQFATEFKTLFIAQRQRFPK